MPAPSSLKRKHGLVMRSQPSPERRYHSAHMKHPDLSHRGSGERALSRRHAGFADVAPLLAFGLSTLFATALVAGLIP